MLCEDADASVNGQWWYRSNEVMMPPGTAHAAWPAAAIQYYPHWYFSIQQRPIVVFYSYQILLWYEYETTSVSAYLFSDLQHKNHNSEVGITFTRQLYAQVSPDCTISCALFKFPGKHALHPGLSQGAWGWPLGTPAPGFSFGVWKSCFQTLTTHPRQPGSHHMVAATLTNRPGSNTFWNWRH